MAKKTEDRDWELVKAILTTEELQTIRNDFPDDEKRFFTAAKIEASLKVVLQEGNNVP